MSDNESKFAAFDRQHAAFKQKHPGQSYTKMQMEKTAEALRQGKGHPTLGRNIDGHADWWSAGQPTFAHYLKTFPIAPQSKVIDYGCGSLRVGAHFIRYLDPGCFFGLELAKGLYEMGQEIIGPELLAEKVPRFGLTGSPALREAAAFGADYVYSTAVAFHVHPDELPLYHMNLVKLAAKPGATLFFDTKIADAPLRYRERSWAWPLQMYLDALAPLSFVRAVKMNERTELGVRFENQILEFRR
ncbi:MAG TPA: hypothetical protein VG889_07605 [Rhizomicrobium sp.]|nr:hypothetical protein [Rhizomicrobium sp.]